MLWAGTRPTTPLVTWAQMQAQLRIDTDDEEDYVADLVDAATEYAETALDASLLTRTITATYFQQQGMVNLLVGYNLRHKLFLPRGPVQSINSVTDSTGLQITNYTLEREGSADELSIAQEFVSPLTVVYVAGYGDDPTDVPADIRMAIRTHVASLWRNRESISDRKMEATPQSLEAFYRLKRRTTSVA